MKTKIITLPLIALFVVNVCAAQVATPDKMYGQLFVDVQMQKVFADGKTFVDCVPLRSVNEIVNDYKKRKSANFDLKKFVADNFKLPPAPPQLNYIQQEKNISSHITNLWGTLGRQPDLKTAAGSTLLPLPHPYIVPGGRFREVYYWDSYFTMLGLRQSGRVDMIENMVTNFAFLINKYGHIPNGNRSYYLSRSQPPFFSMMVALLAEIKGDVVYKTYMPAMEKEYAFWMDGADKIKNGSANKHLIKLADGTLLNRYCDANNTPRQESYKEDVEVAAKAADELAMRIRVTSPEALKKVLADKKAAINLNMRSGAESGWDFSSRWFADSKNLSTIQVTDIIPVDLNCLLYALEMNISKAKTIAGTNDAAANFLQKATTRKTAILKYCWSEKNNFFYDYNAANKMQSQGITAAGLFPLFVKIATPAQATSVENTLKENLLKAGGIVTTTQHTGQQWDAPNGWAPLQWVSVMGLKNYQKNETAKLIAQRWLSLNEKVYAATGKLMEKYNVEDITKEAGGGEYPSQDGFGWTNGVYLALKQLFNL